MASEQASTTSQFSRGMSKSVQSAKSLERGERQIMQARENRIPRRALGDSLGGRRERTNERTDERVRHEKELMEDHRVQHRAKARERESEGGSAREGHIPLLI